MTLEYGDIFNRVFGKIHDPKLASLENEDREAVMAEWLRAVASQPRVRRKFESLVLDDIIGEIDCELNFPVDEDSDMDFVTELFVLGMMIQWLEPQVNSIVYAAPMIGTKDEKKLLDSQSANIKRLSDMKIELKKMLRDYGYMYNSYVEEDI